MESLPSTLGSEAAYEKIFSCSLTLEEFSRHLHQNGWFDYLEVGPTVVEVLKLTN